MLRHDARPGGREWYRMGTPRRGSGQVCNQRSIASVIAIASARGDVAAAAYLILAAFLFVCVAEPARADTAPTSAIPPVVIQFCAPTAVVQRRSSTVVADNSVVNQASPTVNSMDPSFINITTKNIKIVVSRIECLPLAGHAMPSLHRTPCER